MRVRIKMLIVEREINKKRKELLYEVLVVFNFKKNLVENWKLN